MSLEIEAQRGQLAESVLTNPVYAEAYDLIAEGITAQWRASRDAAEREQLHQLLRVVDKARSLVETTMRDGKVAADKIKQRNTLAQRLGLRRE